MVPPAGAVVTRLQECYPLEVSKSQKNDDEPTGLSANCISSTSDDLSTLVKLKELLDSGILTQEEFDAKKKQLLGL